MINTIARELGNGRQLDTKERKFVTQAVGKLHKAVDGLGSALKTTEAGAEEFRRQLVHRLVAASGQGDEDTVREILDNDRSLRDKLSQVSLPPDSKSTNTFQHNAVYQAVLYERSHMLPILESYGTRMNQANGHGMKPTDLVAYLVNQHMLDYYIDLAKRRQVLLSEPNKDGDNFLHALVNSTISHSSGGLDGSYWYRTKELIPGIIRTVVAEGLVDPRTPNPQTGLTPIGLVRKHLASLEEKTESTPAEVLDVFREIDKALIPDT